MPSKRFQKHTEDFTCENCGADVKGSGYTDHCPKCLVSKHVDNNPGDRASKCGGLMFPTGAHYEDGNFVIRYKCKGCGVQKNVGSAPDDDREKLFGLTDSRAR